LRSATLRHCGAERSEEPGIHIHQRGGYGFRASRAVHMARQMKAGQVFVNAYGAGGGIELPFGGMKKSGHAREKGFEAL
jgi:acyl-CoA reductase-like NAD-dependent aldehyde dehydrogenase